MRVKHTHNFWIVPLKGCCLPSSAHHHHHHTHPHFLFLVGWTEDNSGSEPASTLQTRATPQEAEEQQKRRIRDLWTLWSKTIPPFWIFFFFFPTLIACGNSQAKDRIRAEAATYSATETTCIINPLCHSGNSPFWTFDGGKKQKPKPSLNH